MSYFNFSIRDFFIGRVPRRAKISSRDIAMISDLHLAELGERNPWAGWSLFVILIVLLAGGGWASWAKLDEVTVGSGQVIPFSRDQVVQSLDGGLLDEILVREGDVVDKDQVLLRINAIRSNAFYREGHSKTLALRATAARLTAEASGQPLYFDKDLRTSQPDTVALETSAYESRRHALDEAIKSKEHELALSEDELRITEPLSQKGIVSVVDVLRLRRQVSEISGQITDLRNKYGAESATELTRTKSELASLGAVVAGRAEQVKQTVLRSPARGVVKHIRISTVGGVIRPGEEIIVIVPTEDRLLVEARIRPADVAFLRPGLPATVKISAYDYAIYGALEGTLDLISPDTLQDDIRRDETFYRIQVRTKQGSLRDGKGKILPIIPGMIASVEILTGRKTVMDYLLKPVLKSRDAMRER